MRNTGFQFPGKRINADNAAVDRGAAVGNDSERKMKVERAVTSCLPVVWRDVGPAGSHIERAWSWEWGKSDRESVEQVHLCCKKSASAKPIAKFRIHLAIAKKAGATKGAANTEVRV